MASAAFAYTGNTFLFTGLTGGGTLRVEGFDPAMFESDLSVTKSAASSRVHAGDNVVYILSVSNTGPTMPWG